MKKYRVTVRVMTYETHEVVVEGIGEAEEHHPLGVYKDGTDQARDSELVGDLFHLADELGMGRPAILRTAHDFYVEGVSVVAPYPLADEK